MNQQTPPQQEKGQAMVIMAFALIVLLGMLALSIDGGRAFTERRKAQNAADASALAAVRELGSGASSATARRIAYETALRNGYDLTEEDISIIDVAIDYGTYNPGLTGSYEISITVDSGVEANFAQFVYDSFLDVNAYSAMEVVLSRSPFAGFGMVSLASSGCPSSPLDPYGIGGGAGNSGGVSIYGGSILSNIPSGCAFYVNNTGDGVFACTVEFPVGTGDAAAACLAAGGQLIDLQAVAASSTCDGAGCDNNISDIDSGFNNGVPLPDPMENLPAPICLGSESGDGPAPAVDTSGRLRYQPGYYTPSGLSVAGVSEYAPGIYCIRADGNSSATSNTLQPSNADEIDATSGVLLYFYNGGEGDGSYAASLNAGGQGNFHLLAPGNGDELNCLDEPEPLDSEAARADACNYQGLAIFTEQNKTNTIDLGGNGSVQIYGTVYGNRSIVNAHGGGSTGQEVQIHGQVLVYQIANDGNGSLQVWYEEQYSYIVPPYINALD